MLAARSKIVPKSPDRPQPTRPERRSTRGRNAVTAAERALPPADDPVLHALEAEAERARPDQLPLFTSRGDGSFAPRLGGLSPLSPDSSLDLARTWYRRELEQGRRPRNTVESYSYDLMVLERLIGPKPIDRIDRRDIARYLGEATSRTTRKRRLTTARRFFRFLIDDARVLSADPTEGYYPHAIQLRSPVPLFADEQAALLAVAEADEPWAAPAIWLMLRLGLTRSELLALRRDHIDRADPQRPVVFIFYDDVTKQGKERTLAADETFAALYDAYLESLAARLASEVGDRLFPVGPPAVNGMVERVRVAAGITKEVTPQTLRHTFAVEQARAGADEAQLLKLLGLADDPRNRASVGRYLKLAEPPMETETGPRVEDRGPR